MSNVHLCFSFWSILPTILHAQLDDMRFAPISVEQGLSNFSITAIVQDQQGFLWIGTEDGLNKYDGYTFTVYKTDPADTLALRNSFIRCLYVDREGNLWVGSTGLYRYNPATDKFDRFENVVRNSPSLIDKNVNAMIEDAQGVFWIGTDAGLYHYRVGSAGILPASQGGALRSPQLAKIFPQQQVCTHYQHDPHDPTSISDDVITAIFADRAGTLWIGTNAGLNRYDQQKNTFIRYRHAPNNPRSLSQDVIFCIREDPKQRGVLWIGTNAGLNQYDQHKDEFVRYPLDPRDQIRDVIFALYEDRQGVLWAGTMHFGLWRYEAATGRFIRFLHDTEASTSLSQSRVPCIYEDRSGILWVGTYRGGLNRHVRRQAAFQHYKIDKEVYAVLEDRSGNLWLGTDFYGLFKNDWQRGRWVQYVHDPQNPKSLGGDGVRAIREDREGKIWIGAGAVVSRHNLEADNFVSFHYPSGNSQNSGCKVLYEDREGELWLGTIGRGASLNHWEREKKTFTSCLLDSQDTEVWSLAEGKAGELWVGTFGRGLYRLDKKTKASVPGPFSLNNSHALQTIYSLYVDTTGGVWVGTFGEGLNRYNPRNGKIEQYTERDGLPDNFVKSILPDAHGNLWLSTDKGLSKFNPRMRTFRNYTVQDGLLSNVFLSGAAYKSRAGRLFFGCDKGAIAFHPDSLKDNEHVPPIAITQFKVFEESLPLPLPRFLRDAALPELRLSYLQNFFSFEFAALDFSVPEKNQYAYQLEGFDRDWIRAGTRRYANYTNVPPGEYVFRVKGANNDGAWNETGATIKITIVPPFWKTWWFTNLFWVILVVVMSGTIRYIEVRKLAERLRALEKQQALERERVRISQDMHDEVGASLTEIAILSELARKDLRGGKEAESRLQKISERAREVIDNIGEIIWAINPEHDRLDDVSAYMRQYAGRYLMAAGLKYRCEFPEALPEIHLSAEARRNLFLVFKEALHNIVKHASAGEVLLRLSCTAQRLELFITDNGKGFARENVSHFGSGLLNMKKRIEAIGGNFALQSRPEGGTQISVTVELAMPVS